MFLKLCFQLYIFALLPSGYKALDRRPVVKLPQGLVVGVKVFTDTGRLADAFFGLPYAASPTGNLRFAPPQKHEGWNGSYQALNYKPPCPQLPIQDSTQYTEDCLYLNVWTPESSPRMGPIPVVMFIEGIEFSKRNKIAVAGQDLAMEDLIVVTLSYRMNVFGFFCMGVPEARGNLGLLDQYFAILWVRENIKYFGGDPEKITLFGHAAGAASAILHMISPRTSGMFHRLIVSSGSVVSPWHLTEYNKTTSASQKILKILGCLYPNYLNSLRCTQIKSTEDILKAYEEYVEFGNGKDDFLPVLDTFLPENNRYLPVSPGQMILEGTFPQVPILTGIGQPIADPQFSQWADLASHGMVQLQQFIEQSKIPEVIRRYNFNNKHQEEIIELIKWKYDISNQSEVKDLLKRLKQMHFEVRIEAPHFLQLNSLQSSYVQPIYVYYIDTLGIEINMNDTFITADLLLLFGPLLLNQLGRRRFNSVELQLSKQMKRLWSNFIKFGNPTPGNNRQQWPPYTANKYYIENLSSDSRRNEDVSSRQVSFWTQLLPKISHIETQSSNNNAIELQRSLDPTAGYRHALYTLIALVIALLALLLVCIVLLKRRSKERERHLHMSY